MTSFRRIVLSTLTVASAWLLSACGGGGGSTTPAPVTTNDTVVATPSAPSSGVQTTVGGSTTVTIAFTSSDGNAATNLSVTNLGSLPTGWSATAPTFTCSSLSTGNGCTLTLSFAPTGAVSGTLSLGYSYTNNAGTAKTGTLSLPYSTTTNDNAVATAAPASPYAVIVGGTQSVTVTFTTDDGNPGAALTITSGLTTLPTGWTATSNATPCATFSSGNGCQLVLKYTPTAAASGTFAIGYSYGSNNGTAKNGSISLVYAATTHNHVVGAVAPTSVVATIGAASNATITFTTDDGNPATNLTINSGLTTLPSGWSVPAGGNLTPCARVSTGNGCQLLLKYLPTQPASGTVSLGYSYVDDSGTNQAGTVQIPYTATSNNTLQAQANPTGQITAPTNTGSTPVTVTYTSSDSFNVTNVQFTNLGSLPTGWSLGTGTTSTYSCATVNTGTSCQVHLVYAPLTGATAGTLALQYTYVNNAGTASSGTTNITYAPVAHNTVNGVVSPASPIVVTTNSTNTVTITFNTNDTNNATTLSVTLPTLTGTGWSTTAVSPFTCGTVAPTPSTACVLTLTYHPTADTTSAQNLVFPYTYLDNTTTAESGSLTVNYSSTSNNVLGVASPGAVALPTSATAQSVTVTFNTDASGGATTFSATIPTVAGWTATQTSPYTCSSVSQSGTACQISLTYTPSAATAPATFTIPYSYTSNGGVAKSGSVTIPFTNPGYAYIADGGNNGTTTTGGNKVVQCTIGSGGALSGCVTAYSLTNLDPRAIVFNGAFAYISARINGGAVYVCPVTIATGVLGACTDSGNTFSAPQGMAVSNGWLFVANTGGTVSACQIQGNGSLSGGCSTTGTFSASGAAFVSPAAVAISGNHAYVADELYDGSTGAATANGSVVLCSVSGGVLSNCAVAAAGISTTGGILGHNAPDALAINGPSLIAGFPGGSSICTLNPTTGGLAACTPTGFDTDTHGVATANNILYIGDNQTPALYGCSMSGISFGGNCPTITGTTVVSPEGITIN